MTQIDDADREAMRDALSRFLRADLTEDALRLGMQGELGYDASVWHQLAEMGLLGIAVDEAFGGIGGSPVDVAMVAEELGHSLTPVPFIETCVIATALLQACEHNDAIEQILRGVVQGSVTVALGGNASPAPYPDTNCNLTLQGDAISGEVSLVMHGASADFLLLLFEVGAAVQLVLVPKHESIATEPQKANDPALRPAKMRFDLTPCAVLQGWTADDLERARLHGVAALSAQQTGAARAIFGVTIDYLKTRYQFGRPIGSFQALKHMAADLLVEVESATSAARAAATALARSSADASRSVSLAGFICNDAFRAVTAQAIQMHGGIAYTQEHVAHLYWRRARATLSMLGDSESHREAYLRAWEVSA